MGFHVIIPARYASQRLPGKPLLDIAGKPMIQHVHERAVESGAATVTVATDDVRIAKAVQGFGGTACLTAEHHRSGTERLAETASLLGLGEDDIVVNLQGDEPAMPPELLTQVAENLQAHPHGVMATLCTPIATIAELFDPNVVKVVTDRDGFALYFSRAAIPWDREEFSTGTDRLPQHTAYLRHLGIYAYRVGYLQKYVEMPGCPLEHAESLEQLRVLWNGGRIHVAQAVALPPAPGVDTEEHLEAVTRCFQGRSS